jgi:hypothetical protein
LACRSTSRSSVENIYEHNMRPMRASEPCRYSHLHTEAPAQLWDRPLLMR